MFSRTYKILNSSIEISANLREIHDYLGRVLRLFEISDMSMSIRYFKKLKKTLCINIKDNKNENIVRSYRIVVRCMRSIMGERCAFIHASSVAFCGKNLLFIGEGKSGKSTLSSFMRDEGARILGDDISLLDIERKTLLPFPVITNFRSGVYCRLKAKHKAFFDKLLRKYGGLSRINIGLLSESEFEKCFEYFKEFYDIEKPYGDYAANSLIFIFLTRNRSFSAPSLKAVGCSEAIRLFFSSLRIIPEIDKVMTKELTGLLLGASHYRLESGEINRTVDLIKKTFSD